MKREYKPGDEVWVRVSVKKVDYQDHLCLEHNGNVTYDLAEDIRTAEDFKDEHDAAIVEATEAWRDGKALWNKPWNAVDAKRKAHKPKTAEDVLLTLKVPDDVFSLYAHVFIKELRKAGLLKDSNE